MPWMSQGDTLPDGHTDPDSGREAILGSHTGQILEPSTFPLLPPKVKCLPACGRKRPPRATAHAHPLTDPKRRARGGHSRALVFGVVRAAF